ncbi:MAG: hypothetical protein EU542_07265 [Promethearchaeota archaeon]|nr:MAG: hypothetical protein EU542_07265 [Candidatus Lokiarchaeota archaeon]
MKELFELGIVFRGFVLVKHKFKKLSTIKGIQESSKDLRGAFISAINSFATNAFNNISLEYLESDKILFVFKLADVKALDCNSEEPVILYGLISKPKKDPDKLVKKFFEKVQPILNLFVKKYTNKDFTELNQFEPFAEEIKNFF